MTRLLQRIMKPVLPVSRLAMARSLSCGAEDAPYATQEAGLEDFVQTQRSRDPAWWIIVGGACKARQRPSDHSPRWCYAAGGATDGRSRLGEHQRCARGASAGCMTRRVALSRCDPG